MRAAPPLRSNALSTHPSSPLPVLRPDLADAPASGASAPRWGELGVATAQSHVPRMLHVARRLLGSDDLAWDAVQEALILLWHETHAPRDLAGWLVRTVVHRSLHQARSLRRRRLNEERGGAGPRRDLEHSDPARAAQFGELARLVEQGVRELPEPFQAVLRRRDLHGLDYEEIARELGLPLGTVRSRLHRARALLRSRLVQSVHDFSSCWVCELDAGD